MSIAYWCIVIAFFIPIGLVGYAKFAGNGKYDNNAPRKQLASLDGARARANWAQLNTYEAFPPFAAGVIIAHLHDVTQSSIDIAAVIFIVARLLYGFCYIKDLATMRSLVFGIGFFAMLSLYILSALA